MKQDTLDKVQKQLTGISALVDVWWQTVRRDLTQLAMTPRWTQWAEELLLPLMYWQEQLRRTRCPGHKAQIALVLQAVEEALERHPCTRQLKPEVLAGWKAWAAEHAKAFQRASSAVEGRNGASVLDGTRCALNHLPRWPDDAAWAWATHQSVTTHSRTDRETAA